MSIPRRCGRTPETSAAELRERLRRLAAERRHFGYQRLGVLLRRQGVSMNKRRLFRALPSLERPDIEDVLDAAVAGAFGDELAVGLLVGLGLLERLPPAPRSGSGSASATFASSAFSRCFVVCRSRRIVSPLVV